MMSFLLVGFAAAFSLADPTVKDCGGGKTIFTVNSVSLTPSNPLPNDDVTLHLDYTVPNGALITGGDATYSVTYNFIPLSPTTEALCSNIPCPLGPGRYVNSSISKWPSGLTGSLTTTLKWTDQSANQLLCISILAKL
jgi:hypothetical protein